MTQVDIKALFSDESILAISKPPDIPFHTESREDQGSPFKGIVERVKEQYCKNDGDTLFPIHRLDRMTSGVMIFAKNRETNARLSAQLSSREMEKYYLAVSDKKPSKKQGSIIGDMIKSRRGAYKLCRTREKPAVTYFKSSLAVIESRKSWVFVLKPETGKTHQLRVALQSLGAPIIGDKRYGGCSAARGYLHAYCIRFVLNGKLYDIKDGTLRGDDFCFADLADAFPALTRPDTLDWGKKASRLPLDAIS